MRDSKGFCHVAGDHCNAPAGYAVGGNVGWRGFCTADVKVDTVCYKCGYNVCKECSKLHTYRGRRCRICEYCIEEINESKTKRL